MVRIFTHIMTFNTCNNFIRHRYHFYYMDEETEIINFPKST